MPTPDKYDFTLVFTGKNEVNALVRRRLVVQTKTKGEAIMIGRKIAEDSKGKWRFEKVEA